MDGNLKHIAFIMDGNGRWAKKLGKPRIFGHEAGMHKIEEVCTWCREENIRYGSFFGFSKENWKRPDKEVSFIFSLVERYYQEKIPQLMNNGIRFVHIGDRLQLPKKLQDILLQIETVTAANSSFHLLFYFNYSGRWEIAEGMRNFSAAGKFGVPDESELFGYMPSGKYPEPDLIVRTSGEYRISNFLLWQAAYSELYFEQDYWPQYSREHFSAAIEQYRHRERRFGGLV